MQKIKRKIPFAEISIWVLIGAMVALYFPLVFHNTYWADECFSLLMTRRGWVDLVAATAVDVHPPLYYMILKLISMPFPNWFPIYSIVSYLPIIALMVISATYIKKHFGYFSSVIFILLINLTPACFPYNTEVRMYTWPMFFVTLCGIFAFEIIKSEKVKAYKWVCFVICGLGAAYCHNYALISTAVIYAFLFFYIIFKKKSQIVPCIIGYVVTVLGYLPWLFVLLQQFKTVSGDYWIEQVTTIGNCLSFCFGTFFSSHFLMFVLGISVIIYFLTDNNYSAKFKKENGKKTFALDFEFIKKLDYTAIFCILCFATISITALIGIVVSILTRPVFVVRYLYPSIGLLWLGFAITFKHHDTSCKKINLLAIAAIIFTLALGTAYYMPALRQTNAQYNDTKNILSITSEQMQKDDIVKCDMPYFDWTVMPAYYPDNWTYPDYMPDVPLPENSRSWWFMQYEMTEDKKADLESQGFKVEKMAMGYFANFGTNLYLVSPK